MFCIAHPIVHVFLMYMGSFFPEETAKKLLLEVPLRLRDHIIYHDWTKCVKDDSKVICFYNSLLTSQSPSYIFDRFFKTMPRISQEKTVLALTLDRT